MAAGFNGTKLGVKLAVPGGKFGGVVVDGNVITLGVADIPGILGLPCGLNRGLILPPCTGALSSAALGTAAAVGTIEAIGAIGL